MTLAPPAFQPLTAAELTAYQTYEQQRRQRLLSVLLPLSAGLLGLAA